MAEDEQVRHLGIARHVQQTRLQEQAIRGLVMVHRGLDGCQRSGAIAVAPMDVRDHQMDVGALVRGSAPSAGKDDEPFECPVNAAVTKDGVVVHGADLIDIQTSRLAAGLEDLRQRRRPMRYEWPRAAERPTDREEKP